MLTITDQLSQLALTGASPSRPKARHTASSASAGQAVLNPYSPSLTAAQLAAIDTSLSSAVAALVHHLTQPLSAQYPHSVILQLRSALTDILTALYEPSWKPLEPSSGTGFRSLICSRPIGLPRALRQAAARVGVDAERWRVALKGKSRDEASFGERERDEWEAWCDPGMVCWRYGGWKYFDSEFDPVRPTPESTITIWQAGPAGSSESSDGYVQPQALTPARPSAAIQIRAPSMAFIPPTPAHSMGAPTVPSPLPFRPASPNLMPAASIGGHSRSTSTTYSARSPSPISEGDEPLMSMRSHVRASTFPVRSGHRASTGSSSSIDSSISDSNSGHTQLLTPASRPGSADPFTAAANAAEADDKTPTHSMRGRDTVAVTPTAPGPGGKTATPSVTPYDGGNVTVLGGGVKLGGGAGCPPGSRPGSVVSQHRMPMMDRSRSPSISLASRALSSALTPDGMSGGGRKPRTRRRIMPTYLGYVGQPGVGGPVGNAFQPMVPIKTQPGQMALPPQQPQMWQGGMGVGVRQPLTRIA